MLSLTIDKFDIIASKGEGRVHLFVSQRPIAVDIVEVVAAVLHKDADGFYGFVFAYECGGSCVHHEY